MASSVKCDFASIIVAYLLHLKTENTSTPKPPAIKSRAEHLLDHVKRELGTELAAAKIPLPIKRSLHKTNEALNVYFNMNQNVCQVCL